MKQERGMIRISNLEKVKEMARMFLHLKLEWDEKDSFLVHHPYFSCCFVSLVKDGVSQMGDLRKPEDMELALNMVKRRIDKAKSVHTITKLMCDKFLLVFFKYIREYLDPEDYATELREAWLTTEFPNADPNLTLAEKVRYFRKADPKLLMSKSDYARFQSLPDEIIVFRGVNKKGSYKGLSWTTDKERAEWFASRWEWNSAVYKATIAKSDVLAYFGERSEEEIVLDSRKLKNVEKL